MKNYDIFISYRRDGGYDTAKHLYDLLDRDGYRVSFDIDTLKNCYFDEELLKRIDQCTDFLLIVDSHCFDRLNKNPYKKEEDWLRLELAYAIEKNKNIIPIFLQGVKSFPNNLPQDIAKVIRRNGPHIEREYFDEFYNKLKTRYLESQPIVKVNKGHTYTSTRTEKPNQVKVVFQSNLQCVVLANGAKCCDIGSRLSVAQYMFPGEYTFKCISKKDSSNIRTITYSLKNTTNLQYVKIEFEPTAADLGITQKQFEKWKTINPGYSPNTTAYDIISDLDSHKRNEQRRKEEAVQKNWKPVVTVVGAIILIVIAIIMISSGVSFFLAAGICAAIGAGLGKALGLFN